MLYAKLIFVLEEINIRNLGVIEQASLEFSPGLNVITGETGAGKTMVLTGLGLLLGKKASSSIVRNGADATSVEGCWDVSHNSVKQAIEDTGAVLEDDAQLFINRTITNDGKSKLLVGGKRTPTTVLDTFSGGLVNIHGQSDQIRLKTSAAQRTALDRFAGEKLSQEKKVYQEIYETWKLITKQLKETETNAASRLREYEQAKQAVEDFEKTQPLPNEDEQLKAEAVALTHVDGIKSGLEETLGYLSNPDGWEMEDALTVLNKANMALSQISNYDPKLAEYSEVLENLIITAQELGVDLTSYQASIDGDALVRLQEVNDRLSTLAQLIRTYGPTLEDALKYWEEASEKVITLNPENNSVEALQEKLANQEVLLENQANKLYELRVSASKTLEANVNKELAGLAMAGSKFIINVERTQTYTVNGGDEASFNIKTPASNVPVPLGKGASGGELSRIMLALELCLADPSSQSTYLFDEVDSGVGGETALEIAKRLALLAQSRQVIVVSHLAQVAAFADNHLEVVKKNDDDKSVVTTVRNLDKPERLRELSRMISGLTDSETGKAHAQELLSEAEKFKQTSNS